MGSHRPTAVLIVGAGIAGLACARILVAGGCRVRLVDKGSRPGGRLATRRGPSGTFDHGAPCFSARGAPFRQQVDAWQKAGVVVPWEGQTLHLAAGEGPSPDTDDQGWVGVPEMNALAAHLARGLDVRARCRIASLVRRDGRWLATGEGASFSAEVAVVTVPAPQAKPLLQDVPSLQAAVAAIEMTPTWTVLAGFAAALSPLPAGATLGAGPLRWIARDSSKPGRRAGERWVLHATTAWSQAHLEESRSMVSETLLEALRRVLGGEPLVARTYLEAHRWRYAAVRRPAGRDCLWDASQRIGVGSDGCLGPSVEDAWRSGTALGRTILRDLAG